MSTDNNEDYLKNIGVGIRAVSDPFFDDSHRVCKIFQRIGVIAEDEEQLCHQIMKEFNCNAPGCTAKFQNLLEFEIHYNSVHRFTCAECKKIKSNARLLEIHIQECHDSFFKALAEKEPVYQCYVSSCNIKFKDAAERKLHCINIHKFPKNFKYEEPPKVKTTKKIKSPNNSSDSGMSMEVDQTHLTKEKNNKEIARKSRIGLNKNQKVKTFSSNKNQHMHQMPGSRSEPLPSKDEYTKTPINSSALQFIPRQLACKSYSKVLTQNAVTIKRKSLDSGGMMELEEALPL